MSNKFGRLIAVNRSKETRSNLVFNVGKILICRRKSFAVYQTIKGLVKISNAVLISYITPYLAKINR